MSAKQIALAELTSLINAWPELRVGQIIFNALDVQGLARTSEGEPRDIFYVTDEQLANALYEYALWSQHVGKS